MTQIMIRKRDAIENVPWTPLSVRVECVRGVGGGSLTAWAYRSVDCPRQTHPSTPVSEILK